MENEIEKTVKEPVTVKKQTSLSKFNTTVKEKGKELNGNIVKRIIIPGVKKLACDAFHMVVDGLFGRTSAPRNNYWSGPSQTPSYNFPQYQQPYGNQYTQPTQQWRGVCDYEDIEFRTYEDALNTLNSMKDAIDAYGWISLNEYYERVGVSTPPTSTKFGWSDLSGVQIVPSPNGYTLTLPRPTFKR